MGICKAIIFLLIWLLSTVISPAHAAGRVTALVSSDEQVFITPLAIFQAGMEDKVQIFTLLGDITRDAAIMDLLIAERPSFIFALGAKAAYLAKIWTRKHQEIPVLFSMVLNWEQYHLLEGQSNMAGISNEVEPGNQFLSLSMFVPGVKRIGVIYNPRHSSAQVKKARKAAAMLDLELIERRINTCRDFRRAYRQLTDQVDGIWVLNDPVTYTLDNMNWLSSRCTKDRLVCVGQGKNLAEIGMMLSVWADLGGIGSQAASMAKNILKRNQPPTATGVMPPLGTHISLNRRTADRIGITITPKTIGMATDVIE